MKTPFNVDQFLNVFREYNESVFPVQVFFYLLAITAVYLTVKGNSKSNVVVSGILAFFWLWMGIVYHLVFFTAINKAAYLFGMLFILQGILFLIFGALRGKLSFKFNRDKYGIAGIVMIFFALVMYPIVGYFYGHMYPSSPTFGLPCPTAIFTFGVLLLTDKKCPAALLIIPSIWSIIGFSAAITLGIIEDIGLLVSGIISVLLLLLRSKTFMKSAIQIQHR